MRATLASRLVAIADWLMIPHKFPRLLYWLARKLDRANTPSAFVGSVRINANYRNR